jgi:hypothetical protein
MQKKHLLILGIFLFFGFLFTTINFVNAQDGLISCGGLNQPPCRICHFFVLLKNVMDFILKIIGLIAVLMLIIGGIHFFFAGGDPGKLETGKRILTSVAIGLIIIFGGYLIINALFTFPGFLSSSFSFSTWYDPSTWFSTNCPY